MCEALEGHYTLWVGGNFDAEGAGMGVVTLSFHGTADGDPVSFNWLEKFWEDGMGGVHIEGKVNCHDGQGVSRYEMDF